MKFPFYVFEFNEEEEKIFTNHFTDEGKFGFEGIWLRNQREANKEQSNWKSEKDQRRRYIQFYDTYEQRSKDGKSYLAITDTYIYISNTLPKKEIKAYRKKDIKALNKNEFIETDADVYLKDDLEIILKSYDRHPKDIEFNNTFTSDYITLDVIIRTKGFPYEEHYNRMWLLSTKMFRVPGKRENPTYINSVDEIIKHLPAQVEMGCGPSIATGIPALHEMHETYYVQNHITKEFYFGKDDKFIVELINNPEIMYKKFSYVPTVCIKAKPTEAYEIFASLYKKGYFKGTVLNNNFDRMVKRFDIDEYILRIYDRNTYLPKIEFEKDIKTLICIGTHADRREVQAQAREKGIKVIYIDPEGFFEGDNFIPYPIEAPKDGDLIYAKTFEEAMAELKDKLL